MMESGWLVIAQTLVKPMPWTLIPAADIDGSSPIPVPVDTVQALPLRPQLPLPRQLDVPCCFRRPVRSPSSAAHPTEWASLRRSRRSGCLRTRALTAPSALIQSSGRPPSVPSIPLEGMGKSVTGPMTTPGSAFCESLPDRPFSSSECGLPNVSERRRRPDCAGSRRLPRTGPWIASSRVHEQNSPCASESAVVARWPGVQNPWQPGVGRARMQVCDATTPTLN